MQSENEYLNEQALAKLKRAVGSKCIDLWGKEIESPSDQDNWNDVMKCLCRLYGIYCYEKDSHRTAWALELLMEAYNQWLG